MSDESQLSSSKMGISRRVAKARLFDLRVERVLRYLNHRHPKSDNGHQKLVQSSRTIQITTSLESWHLLGLISSSPSTIFLKDRGESTSMSEGDVSKEPKSCEGPGCRSSKRGRSSTSNLTETSDGVLRR